MWMHYSKSVLQGVAQNHTADDVQVLRKYSDKTVARDLVKEIESYGGDPANLVTSRTHISCLCSSNC